MPSAIVRSWRMATLGFRTGPKCLRYQALCHIATSIVFVYCWLQWNGGLIPKFLVKEAAQPPGPAVPLLQYFPHLKADASKVTFACASNSKEELEKAIKSDMTVIEGDVVLRGQGTSKQSLTLIMATHPKVTGDMTFEKWLIKAKDAGKAIKLDFQSIEAVELTLQTLNKHKDELLMPLWLSGTVLPGPNSQSDLMMLDPERFLRLCVNDFPRSTLILGWCSGPPGKNDAKEYSWNMVKDMHDLVERWGIIANRPLVFSTKAVYAKQSMPQLKWLLEMTGGALAVFEDKEDGTTVEDVMAIRMKLPINKAYFDLSLELQAKFDAAKVEMPLTPPIRSEQAFHSDDWTVLRNIKGEEFYVGNEAVMLKQGLLVSKATYTGTSEKPLSINGKVTFLAASAPSTLLPDANAINDGAAVVNSFGVEIFLRVTRGARPSAISGIKFFIASDGHITISSQSIPGADVNSVVVWTDMPQCVEFKIEDKGDKVLLTVSSGADFKSVVMRTNDISISEGQLAIRGSGNGFIAIPNFSIT